MLSCKKMILFSVISFLFLNPRIVFALEPLSYESQDLNITISLHETENQRYWIADIQASSDSPLKGAMAIPPAETTSAMANRLNAILAINASGFHQEATIIPMGTIIRNGEIIRKDPTLKKASLTLLSNGDFKFYKLKNRDNIKSLNIENSFTFGPILIKNGDHRTFDDTHRHPRTAIGQIDDYHYLIVIAEGRLDGAIGMTYAELRDIFADHGCKNAYNLDGGGSTTLYFNGEILNRLSDGSERKVVDMIYF